MTIEKSTDQQLIRVTIDGCPHTVSIYEWSKALASVGMFSPPLDSTIAILKEANK